MEMKSKLTLAALLCIGLLATGCSQQQAAMGSQQMTQQQACDCNKEKPVTPPPAVPVKPHLPPPVKRPPPPVQPVTPVVPKVKGNYKGAVAMDPSSKAVMQQYQH